MKPIYIILLAAMNLLWAASYSVFKGLEPYLSYGAIATLRYAVAAATMFILWPWFPGRMPRGRDFFRTLFIGVTVCGVAIRLQVAAAHLGSAGDLSILVALDPLATSIAAAIFLGERIAPRRWTGLLLGMIGVVLLSDFWRPGFRLAGLQASLLFILSFICETPYSVVGKPLIERWGLFKVVGLAFAAGAVTNILLDFVSSGESAFTAAQSLPWQGWVMILYLGLICSALGYSLWYVVIRETPVNVAALSIFMQPLAGLMIAMLWLGEPLHWGQLWGSSVIVGGLMIGLRQRKAAPANMAEVSGC